MMIMITTIRRHTIHNNIQRAFKSRWVSSWVYRTPSTD